MMFDPWVMGLLCACSFIIGLGMGSKGEKE
jgi:predicted outer membrane lipoprotein